MATVFKKTSMLTDVPFHYCPGCTHGIIHRLVAEAIEELGVADKAVGVAPVGCAVFAYKYFNCDMQEAAHGRAPAVATGIKRALPDRCVFTYQGDGDLASIGAAEINHACARGEKFTTIFINNAIYGMTGGQMAPTTLLGMKTMFNCLGHEMAQNDTVATLLEKQVQSGVRWEATVRRDVYKRQLPRFAAIVCMQTMGSSSLSRMAASKLFTTTNVNGTKVSSDTSLVRCV